MEQAYLARIRAQFPALTFASSRLITTGWDNDVVILDEALAFRFPKRDDYGAKFKAEVRLLEYLAPRSPLPVPEYTYLADGLEFGGYLMLRGAEMRSSLFSELAPSQRLGIAAQLGEFLSVMHATPIELARDFGFVDEPEGYRWNPARTASIFDDVRNLVLPRLSTEESNWIEHQFNRYLSLGFDAGIRVIHSDFVGDHIFVDPGAGRVSGVIDFADVAFADPAIDFSGLWDIGEAFVQQVLAHYHGLVDDDFLERAKFPALVHMVANMLEIAQGQAIPVSFDSCRASLAQVMVSGLSL